MTFAMRTKKLIFLSMAMLISCFCKANSCIESERIALLQFKQGLNDPGNRLSSWVGNDCCVWAGVICHNSTAHVHQLRLRNPFGEDDETDAAYLRNALGGELSSSLLNLKHLDHLDLSGNRFQGIPVPTFIGSLENLVYLNLSDAGFGGAIPYQLGNLTRMRFLGLRSYYVLSADNLGWLSGLSSLKYLDMSNMDLRNALDWLQVISSLPSLVELHFSECGLINVTSSVATTNISTSLAILDLSYNFHLKPTWVFSLNNLVSLDISYCGFYGPVPSGLQNMTGLEFLAFESSGLSGPLPDQFGLLQNLLSLTLSNNSISGSIPSSIQKLSFLNHLDLSYNQLKGTPLGSFGQLRMLHFLDISHNQLQGVVSESHFANLTRLRVFDARENNLTFKPSSKWIPPFQLIGLDLSSWKLGPRFPRWIQTQRYLMDLSLAKTGISDSIPIWLWNMSSNLTDLNLSRNQIYGGIPNLLHSYSLKSIDLSFNHIGGPLPVISSIVYRLDLSSNSFSESLHHFLCNEAEAPNELRYLNLANNHLTGMIPDCWIKWKHLYEISLENNSFEGKIPNSFGSLPLLSFLKLRKNRLSGIPSSLQNYTNLIFLDLAENKLDDKIPAWIGNMFTLTVLNLHSNKFYSEIHLKLCQLTSLQILDLAFNNLSGTIPSCFRNFNGMTKKPS